MSENEAMTITEFLDARIAEDESVARAAIATTSPDAWDNPTEFGNYYPEDVAFWSSQTPYRVLAECAAKRALLDIDFQTSAVLDNHRVMASVYKDHPDYQQEWSE